MFLSMRKGLPSLTAAQQKYIRTKVFEKYGYYWKGGQVRCMCCGHYFRVSTPELAVSLELDSHTCPECGEVIQLRFWRECNNKCYGGYEDIRNVSFVTTYKGYTVVRTYHVTRWTPIGDHTKYHINEVYQNWIDDSGKEVILSKKYTRSIYHFRWANMSDWGIRKHNAHCSGYFSMPDVFDITGNFLYPISRVTPMLKRNGWSNDLLHVIDINHVELIQKMLTEPFAEELVKTRQYSLLCQWMKEGAPEKSNIRWLHAMRICNRNNYIVKDASMWIDYIDLLHYFHKDIRNAHYVCPDNLKEEHDRLFLRKERIENAKEVARKVAEAKKHEKLYRKHRGMFFGICFGNKDIVVSVIASVKEMAEEGVVLHHCVYTNEYYDHKKHPNSLILSAKDQQGNRLETVEISTKTWSIVQCRGLLNRPSPFHNQIVQLVRDNMGLLRKAA